MRSAKILQSFISRHLKLSCIRVVKIWLRAKYLTFFSLNLTILTNFDRKVYHIIYTVKDYSRSIEWLEYHTWVWYSNHSIDRLLYLYSSRWKWLKIPGIFRNILKLYENFLKSGIPWRNLMSAYLYSLKNNAYYS